MLGKHAIEETSPKGRGFLFTEVSLCPRKSETGHKSEVLECIHAHRALQDGGHTHPERPAKSRRLDSKSGPEGHILHVTNLRKGQSLPQVLIQKPNILVQVPTIWPSMCPLGLHQDPEASCYPAETAGGVLDCVHYTNPGRVPGDGSGPSVLAGICSEQAQVRPRTYPDNRVPGVLSELCQTGVKSSCREGKEYQVRDTASARKQRVPYKKTAPAPGRTPGSY